MYSSFYDLEASSHVATIRQLHQVLEANLHVLEEVCVRITIAKDNLDQIINNLKFFRPKISKFNANRFEKCEWLYFPFFNYWNVELFPFFNRAIKFIDMAVINLMGKCLRKIIMKFVFESQHWIIITSVKKKEMPHYKFCPRKKDSGCPSTSTHCVFHFCNVRKKTRYA